jgi:hypothetical protein
MTSTGPQDYVGPLSRYDLKLLEIIKDRAHCPDRGISGVAGSPTMTPETIQIASSQIGRGHAVAQEPIAETSEDLHLQADGSWRISQLRQLRRVTFSESRKRARNPNSSGINRHVQLPFPGRKEESAPTI